MMPAYNHCWGLAKIRVLSSFHRSELPTCFVDHDEDRGTLALYGAQAMEALECEGGSYQDVTQLHLCCIGIEEAVPYLSKLPIALPNVTVSWAPRFLCFFLAPPTLAPAPLPSPGGYVTLL